MDYKSTLNMPKSGFPMRAGLPKREPEMLKHWEYCCLSHFHILPGAENLLETIPDRRHILWFYRPL